MGFMLRDLSVLAYAQGFTLWHYKAAAAKLSAAGQAGFFDDAADMLACGDIVMMSSAEGARIVVVAGTAGSVVTAPLG